MSYWTTMLSRACREDSLRAYVKGALAQRKYRRHTMIPPLVYMGNLALAQRFKHIKGCVVECGVWRGGMSAGLAEVLGPERHYYLFDSFRGLPPPGEKD